MTSVILWHPLITPNVKPREFVCRKKSLEIGGKKWQKKVSNRYFLVGNQLEWSNRESVTLQSLMTGLIFNKPDDPIGFIEDALNQIRNRPENEAVVWDLFVQNPPTRRPGMQWHN